MAINIVNLWNIDPGLNLNRMVWTHPAGWHVTLFFLGATPENQLGMIEHLIEEAFNNLQPFTSQLSGVGVFPEKGQPRVLWMGLENLYPFMASYARLGELLLESGFIFDPKPLKPHLTLARIKSVINRPALESLLGKYQFQSFGTIDINRVTLFESVSSPHGVTYQPLYEKWLLKVYL